MLKDVFNMLSKDNVIDKCDLELQSGRMLSKDNIKAVKGIF